eukprot:1055993-Pelagomonas_calceolata.AAC.1
MPALTQICPIFWLQALRAWSLIMSDAGKSSANKETRQAKFGHYLSAAYFLGMPAKFGGPDVQGVAPGNK